MTIERDLDSRLLTFFEEASVQAPPASLLARSLARVDRTRQRRSWLVSGGLFGRPAGFVVGRMAIPAWVVVALVALLAIAFVAVGSQLLKSQQIVVSPPDRSPLQSNPTPEETIMPTLEPGSVARPGMFASLGEFKAASDTVAWFSTESAIFRTDDAGRTWREVEPAGWSAAWTAAFIDADTAFASPGGSPATIAVTHDGGASWASVRLHSGAASGSLVFSIHTPADGFATFFDAHEPVLSTAGALKIFHTIDGGLTWTGPVPGAVPHMDATSDKLYPPIGGYLWQSAGKAPGVPYDNRFYLSGDGGANWAEYQFPINANSPKGALKSILDVLHEDSGRLLVSFSAARNGPGALPNAVYESTDDPASWRLLLTEPDGDYDVQFLSETTWVMTSGAPTEVRSTIDAGATWSTVVPTVSLYYVQPFSARQWATLRTGWAKEECRWLADCTQDPDTSVVLVTTDSGATWREIGQ